MPGLPRWLRARHGGPADAGLQPERTSLAWDRTVLAFAVVSAFSLRWVGQFGWPAIVVAVIGLSTALAIQVTQRRRHHGNVAGLLDRNADTDLAGVLGLTAAVMLIGVMELMMILSS